MLTPTHLDTLTDLLGPTPARFRSPTPEQRAARRAAAADRARIAAQIDAELAAAASRLAADRGSSRSSAGPDDTDTTADGPLEDPPPF